MKENINSLRMQRLCVLLIVTGFVCIIVMMQAGTADKAGWNIPQYSVQRMSAQTNMTSKGVIVREKKPSFKMMTVTNGNRPVVVPEDKIRR